MAKNLVICCDGTNNSLQRPLTNVALLSRLASGKGPAQFVYYDVGVGVEASPNLSTRIGQTVSRWSGLAFGTGLVANVEQAYLALVDHYEPGDQVFLLGFSRGAYTARVIAGLLQNYGLLRRDQRNDAPKVVAAFKNLFPKKTPKDSQNEKARKEQEERFALAGKIRKTQSVECPIHFLGLFDTVSSLGWAFDPKTFPNTARMPSVRKIRHALALDERRAKFRTNRVTPLDGQDVREVWFAGVHSDVGGGYEPPRDRLSRIPLRWMLREARQSGLLVDPAEEAALQLDATVLEDEQAPQNESLSGAWWPLEVLPLPHLEQTPTGWVERKRLYRGNGWRRLRPDDWVSSSVRRRRPAIKNQHWKDVEGTVRWEE